MGTQSLLNSSHRYVLAGAIAALTLTSGVNGQAQDKPAGPAAPQPPAAQSQPAMPRIIVTAGRSTVLTTDFNVSRIALTNPAVADATVVAPREILIDGKTAGTISLIVWGDDSRRTQYDLVVEQPVAALQQQLQALFPGERIEVSTNEDATVLSGTRLEHERDAARRGDRQGSRHQAFRDQHAAGSRRQRESAGAAAGALCRGQSSRAARAWRVTVHLGNRTLEHLGGVRRRGSSRRRDSPT